MQELESFAPQTGDCTVEDLIELFGKPEEIAQQLLDAVPLKTRVEIQHKKWAFATTAFAAICALLIGMSYWCWLVSQGHIEVKTYESEPIILSDEEFEKRFGKEFEDFFEEEP